MTDNKVDDDLSDYTLILKDPMQNNIFQVEEQENQIDIGNEFNAPRLGLNYAEIQSASETFFPSTVAFHDF